MSFFIDHFSVGVLRAYSRLRLAYLEIIVGQCSQVSVLLLLQVQSLWDEKHE